MSNSKWVKNINLLIYIIGSLYITMKSFVEQMLCI